MAHQISAHGVTGAQELTITVTLHKLWLSTPSPGEAVQPPPCASEVGLHNCSVLPLSTLYVSLWFLGFLLYLERSFPPQNHKNSLGCFIIAL